MSSKEKYIHIPYSDLYPKLFLKEKERIQSHLPKSAAIEHVGSTSVEGLAGKGIIDIAIAANQEDIDVISSALQALGYEYRPAFSTPDREYFVGYITDEKQKDRRYHIHLTYPLSQVWKELIYFRNYLRSHPEVAKEYSELKLKAIKQCEGDGKLYRKIKEPFFQRILASLSLE